MDFNLSSDQQMLRDTVRRVAVERISAQSRQCERERALPAELLGELGELGLAGILVAPEQDGAGLGATELALVIEELARADGGLAWVVAAHNIAALLLERAGPSGASWCSRAARGECWLAWVTAEPGGELEMRTRAELRQDEWHLDGTKVGVPNGHRPECGILMAQTGAARTAFVLPVSSPGLTVRPSAEVLGLRSAGPSTWLLTDVRLDDRQRLGDEGGAEALFGGVRPLWHVALAALGVGLGRAALAAAAAYAGERKQFGRPIGEFQAIQWKLADAATGLEAAALLTQRAAAQPNATGAEAAMAKLAAARAASFAADVAVQIHGGYGYTVEFVPERLYRDTQVLVAALAPVHTLRQTVADQLLGDRAG